MENKNILDFIQKLQSAIGAKPTAPTGESESAETGRVNAAVRSETENAGGVNERKTGADQKKASVSVFPSYAAADDKNGKSFLKTYNPFGEALQNRPQVSAPRAKMKPKEKIDLSSSKNLAGDKKTDVSKNMLDLINKHNRISSELKKRGD